MPVQRCQRDGEQGWQWGNSGKCYLASEEGSDDNAKQKAHLQGAAIGEQKMAELDVPIIKKGIFNQLEITDLKRLVADTQKAMPYLLEAQQAGTYRGESNARFNGEPIPPFLHLRHYPEDIALEKVSEWASGVEMSPDVRLMNGEEWGFVKFTQVDPELAKLLSVGFPFRSAEFLPNFENPDTGEVYPVVLRSVAFLDANTEPAVPQFPGYSVKLASNELGVQVVSCQVPNINQSDKETDTMAEETAKTVKLSQEDLQRFEAMEQRFEAMEQENQTLKGVVNEIKEEKDSLTSQIAKLQAESKASKTEAFCLQLERDYNLTPAALDAIRPVLNPENGVVKLSEDAEAIPVEQAYFQSLETVLKLAKEKDALFVPTQAVELPSGKQQEKQLTASEARDAQIVKLRAEAKEKGEDLSYADALMTINATSNSILEKIAQVEVDGEGA